MSPILVTVTVTSQSDSDLEGSFERQPQRNKPNGVDPNSSDLDYCVRKNEGKTLRFSEDCLYSSEII